MRLRLQIKSSRKFIHPVIRQLSLSTYQVTILVFWVSDLCSYSCSYWSLEYNTCPNNSRIFSCKLYQNTQIFVTLCSPSMQIETTYVAYSDYMFHKAANSACELVQNRKQLAASYSATVINHRSPFHSMPNLQNYFIRSLPLVY